MANNNFDLNSINQQIQQLQNKAAQLNQMQGALQQPGQPQPTATTYPKIAKEPESIEDILDNPAWRNELQTQFANSELGAKAKYHMDVLFSEFCEKETGYKSTMLEEMRKQQPVKAGKLPKKTPEATGLKEEPKNDA